MSQLVDTSEAVYGVLDGAPAATFSQEFDVLLRRYRPSEVVASSLTGVSVYVYPWSREQTNQTRGSVTEEVRLAVEILAPATPSQTDVIDGLMELTSEIGDYLIQTRLATGGMCTAVTNDPPFDGVALETKNIFRSLQMITYKQARSI